MASAYWKCVFVLLHTPKPVYPPINLFGMKTAASQINWTEQNAKVQLYIYCCITLNQSGSKSANVKALNGGL